MTEISSSAAAIATDGLAVPSVLSLADPHLAVLGVLIGFWALDRVLAAIEWLRRVHIEDVDGGSHPSGAE